MRLLSHSAIGVRGTTKEKLVAQFNAWEAQGYPTPPTPSLLAGLFYSRYKQRYRMFPCSVVRDDIKNFEYFLTTFMAEDVTLAPYVIEHFFMLKHFNNIQPATFCNRNILSKWGAFEQAEKLRSRYGVGEQAEYPRFQEYGTRRV